MNITKYKTDNSNLVFIGKTDDEEYYLEFKDEDVRGWSFMGLRPETEENLRSCARETEPEEMLGISRQEFENISYYFNYDKFADDMEQDWYERYDIQAEREEDGETLYLGFGSGQDIFNYFESNKINTFEDFCNHFEEIGIDEETFKKLIVIIKKGQKKDVLNMTVEEKKEEMEEMKIALNFSK